MPDLCEQFGSIDIYLFDQILRGRIAPGMRIFDAGCGSGRNLVYLLREGYEVFGVDEDPRAVEATRRLAASIAPALPSSTGCPTTAICFRPATFSATHKSAGSSAPGSCRFSFGDGSKPFANFFAKPRAPSQSIF